jgi:hypothetical protein
MLAISKAPASHAANGGNAWCSNGKMPSNARRASTAKTHHRAVPKSRGHQVQGREHDVLGNLCEQVFWLGTILRLPILEPRTVTPRQDLFRSLTAARPREIFTRFPSLDSRYDRIVCCNSIRLSEASGPVGRRRSLRYATPDTMSSLCMVTPHRPDRGSHSEFPYGKVTFLRLSVGTRSINRFRGSIPA